jgi:hypothetical protein
MVTHEPLSTEFAPLAAFTMLLITGALLDARTAGTSVHATPGLSPGADVTPFGGPKGYAHTATDPGDRCNCDYNNANDRIHVFISFVQVCTRFDLSILTKSRREIVYWL